MISTDDVRGERAGRRYNRKAEAEAEDKGDPADEGPNGDAGDEVDPFELQRQDMNERHNREFRDMHTRHEREHRDIFRRHAKERGKSSVDDKDEE